MPVNKNAYLRYRIIDECLRSNKTLEGIAEEIYNKLGLNVSRRTIQADIMNMKVDILPSNVEIKRKRASNNKLMYSYSDPTYSMQTGALPEEQKKILLENINYIEMFSGLPQLNGMSETLSQLKMLVNFGDENRKIFSLEENPYLKGLDKLPTIVKAIQDKIVIGSRIVTHDGKDYTHIISPQYLKQYNRRWYLLGFVVVDGKHLLYNFAIDEMQTCTLYEDKEYYTQNVDWQEYYSSIIGVTHFEGNNIEDVEIKVVDSKVAFLLENNPIHESQVSNWDSEKSSMTITLRVKENWELKNFLRKYAGSLRIIKPDSLRKEYVSLLQKGLDINK